MIEITPPTLQAISRLTYDTKQAPKYFNSASIGLSPRECQERTQEYNVWDRARELATSQLAALYGCPYDRSILSFSATVAVQRILVALGLEVTAQTAGTLLTTDAEYPGILHAVNELWPGRCVVAMVEAMARSGRDGDVSQVLLDAYHLTKPSAVLVSHVSRTTGYQLPARVIQEIRSSDPDCIIIVDGAQALGNITIESELRDCTTAYIASCQKWLGGGDTLGVTFTKTPEVIRDRAVSYSALHSLAGTGRLEAMASAAISASDFLDLPRQTTGQRMKEIARHNSTLATYFSDQVSRIRGLKSVGGAGTWTRNGIVAVLDEEGVISPLYNESLETNNRDRYCIERLSTGTDETLALFARSRLPRHSLRFSLDAPDEPAHFEDLRTRPRAQEPGVVAKLWRFAFHLYHSGQDVERLLEAIRSLSK